MTNPISRLEHVGLPQKEWIEQFRRIAKSTFNVEPSTSQINKIKRNQMWKRCTPEAFLGIIIKEAERNGNMIAGAPRNIPRHNMKKEETP